MSFFLQPQAAPTAPAAQLDPHIAVDATPVMVWFCNLRGELLYGNTAWHRTTGQASARSPLDFAPLVHPDDRDQAKLAPADLPAERIYRLRHADGEYYWVKESIALWADPSGQPLGYAISATDIHAQLEHERLLGVAVLRQGALSQLARTVSQATDTEAVLRQGLRVLCEYLPAPAALLLPVAGSIAPVAHGMAVLTPTPDRAWPLGLIDFCDQPEAFPFPLADFPPGTAGGFALALNPAEPGLGALVLFTTSNHRLDASGQMFARSLGGLLLIALAQERTRQHQAEVAAQALAAQKMEAVGLVAGGIAHDFNNLLTAIRCCAELLRDDLTEPDHITQIGDVLHAATSASHLVRQLLSFSRREVSRPEETNLVELLDSRRGFLRSLLSEHIALEIDLPRGDAWVMIDPGEFEQVLFNLCLNARDAMPTHGLLRLTLRTTSPGEVHLLVSDNGHGITPEVRAKLFTPFFSTKGKGRGTGLGLVTCLTIVEKAGGSLDLDSEPGRGTTFTVRLPIAAAVDSAADAVADPAAPVAAGPARHLLIVEDDDLVRLITERLARSLGYAVTALNCGPAAVAFAQTHGLAHIDALITDVVMPGMNGHELADQLKLLCPDLPTLYMSGYIDDARTLHAIAEPGVHFLQKPFSAADFTRKLTEVLAG